MRSTPVLVAFMLCSTYLHGSEYEVAVVYDTQGVWMMADVDSNPHQGITTLELTLPDGTATTYHSRCAGVRHKNIFDGKGEKLEPQSSGRCVVVEDGMELGHIYYDGANRRVSIGGMNCVARASEATANADWGYPSEGDPGKAGDSYDVKFGEDLVGGMYHFIYRFKMKCTGSPT